MAACGAKTRSGGQCKRSAMTNGRCALHGGKSTGPPKGSQNAMKWGFWSKHVTPEQLAIMQEIDEAAPVDILWNNILVAYSAIIRAQRIMYVDNADDHSDFQTMESSSDAGSSEAHLRQWAWDKHANFMQAQARAQTTLANMIKQFMSVADEQDERRLKLEAMRKNIELTQAQIEKLRNPDGDGDTPDDGFMQALEGKAKEVWDNDADDSDDPTQV